MMLCFNTTYAQQTIDLSGKWNFTIEKEASSDDFVMLPGSMQTNGKGNEVTANTIWTGSTYDSSYYFNPFMAKYRMEGNVKYPFFLTPNKHYVGAACYKRTVNIPKTWKKKRVWLFLERPHIETIVSVNGREVGHQMSLSTPHEYDITDFVRTGTDNVIAIQVYNGIENVGVGQDSHSVTDQTQGNWNGITGRIELRTSPQPRIRIQPDIASREVVVKIDEECYKFALGDSMRLWSEFDPYLYTRKVNHKGREINVTFGIRDIKTKGRQFYLNGMPIWLRGTVESCCFPMTGFPPTDEESWISIFRKCKEYGLNHVRFHSYCPPEAAFAAADKVGIYLQPEGPSWPNHGVKLRRGQVIDKYLLEESKRIIDTYGHHPSFVMMAAGNEPAGDWVNYCNDWVKEMHDYDPTKVYCGASVGGGWAWDNGSEFHVKGGARGLEWKNSAPQSNDDFCRMMDFPRNYPFAEANNSPIIAHELGQWCAFPDFSEIPQYTGVYKAKNFEIFKDMLADNGMASQAGKFLSASGQLQTLCYKYDIERNLRTNDYAGFQLLGLNDYSGQGTALVGILNVNWREKGYVTATEWKEFCSPLVPLAKFPKFVFGANETLTIPVDVYNALSDTTAKITYCITNNTDNTMLAKGTLATLQLPLGKHSGVGSVIQDLSAITAPSKMTLSITINGQWHNHWDFWIYPEIAEKEQTANAVHITDTLDSQALKVLENGGKVLVTAAGKVTLGNDIKQHYLPVFWNTSWFKMRPPHTTGAYIETSHPLFKHDFPTDSWSNLNWWELLNKAQVMNLMELPSEYQSPVQPIDTWHVNRKLGMIIEAKVLNGTLLMTTMDISSNLSSRLVARQMRHAILKYMQSEDFAPSLRVSPETINNFFTKTAPKVDMFTNDSPDELKPALNENKILVPEVKWDSKSLIIDGQRVVPVMGEVHFSRIPASEWKDEVRKMKEGGVTIVATYVFWNHIEEQEGIFNWSGQRDLRRFIEICKEEQLPVILRIGPFCHGEVRNGGIPDWVFTKGCKTRSQDPKFLSFVDKLYRQIFSQIQGLQWKDGGPLMACQFDNEYRGSGDYLMALKHIAKGIGFDLPFYTRTGWPELSKPVPFGEMIPLYGDYADGFWERSIEETAGNYFKAFNFKAFRSSTAIATEQLGKQKERLNEGDEQYPYFTCELGGGMMQAYHRRPYIYPEDAYSMALVKLGSGSNLLGYYMYHGGTNPEGQTWLNEMQRTIATNYNDMPVKNYDFQAPLGEFGQTLPHYYMLRKLHLFMQDYGELLAPMETTFTCRQDIRKGDDTFLRWSYRSQGHSAFIFINNYERLQNLSTKKGVRLEACGIKLPKLTIPAGTMCILPINIDGIKYATAQLIAKRDGKIYMEQISGIPTTIAMQNGKIMKNLKPQGTSKPVFENIYLLTSEEAERLFLPKQTEKNSQIAVGYTKIKEAGPLRKITIGAKGVAEEPSDEDFDNAAIYKITLPSEAMEQPNQQLSIEYQGDCARLYANGKLIADQFQYGRPFLYGLWRLPEGTTELELRILPMQADAPIYLPREADKTPGEKVKRVCIENYI